jgi:hypothetical protein
MTSRTKKSKHLRSGSMTNWLHFWNTQSTTALLQSRNSAFRHRICQQSQSIICQDTYRKNTTVRRVGHRLHVCQEIKKCYTQRATKISGRDI